MITDAIAIENMSSFKNFMNWSQISSDSQYSRVSSSASFFHRTFDSKGREMRRSEFPTGGSYTSSVREGSFELHGNRVITLGLNMSA